MRLTGTSPSGELQVHSTLEVGQAGQTSSAQSQLVPDLSPVITRKQSSSPTHGVLHGFFKPAIAAVMTAAIAFSVFAAPNTAEAQGIQEPVKIERVLAPASTPLDQALDRILAADQNGDGKVVGRRYGYELEGLDSLARAVYDYVDFVNPRGHISVYGLDGRGDYSEGGLGLGYSMRPKHMTGQSILNERDLREGLSLLEKAMKNPKSDQVAQDLGAIRDAAKSQLGLSEKEVDAAIWAATDRLLNRIVQINNAKEISTGNSSALATHAEVIAGLESGSLEKIIAEQTLGKETTHFAGAIREMASRRAAFGASPRAETGQAGDTAMHYVLVVGKRAQEAHLLGEVTAHLPH